MVGDVVAIATEVCVCSRTGCGLAAAFVGEWLLLLRRRLLLCRLLCQD